MKKFRPYFSLLAEVKGRFALAILTGLLAGAAGGLGLPLMIDQVFPMIFESKKTGGRAAPPEWLMNTLDFFGWQQPEPATIVVAACVFLPLVMAIRSFASYANTFLTNRVGLHVLEALRLRAFAKLQTLPLSFHQNHREGDLLARLMSDTTLMQVALVRVASDLIIQPATFVFAVVAMIRLSSQHDGMGVVFGALITIPICVLPIRSLGKNLARRAKKLQAKAGDMTATASENLASQQEIRAYNMEQSQVNQFETDANFFTHFNMKVVKYKAMISPSVELIATIGMTMAIYQGAKQGMALESFLGLFTAMYMAYEPIKKMGAISAALNQAEASLDRLEHILHSEDTIPEPTQPKKIGKAKGEVRFRDVNFSYDDEPVLSSIDLVVPPGQTVALVGPSGAGKSTFVSLIPRFYEVDSGALELDGFDIRDLQKHELRSQIGLVSQTPLLFTGTVAENIRIGRPGASDEEVVEAARQANALDFIEQLPEKFETLVGQRGEGLSGGQRQRVAIARAFLKDAPVLILDEATSALDNKSEEKIRESLAKLSTGKTTFLIAHRLSSIQDAERILVFDQGRIVADGSHAELMQTSALYQSLQSSGQL